MDKTPLAVRLGEFVARLRFDDLPPEVVDKAKALVNHALTVGMTGFAHPRSAAARRAVIRQARLGVKRIGAGQGATLWVDGSRVTRAGAAFASGVAVAVNNQCDSSHMLTHPGVLIVPAGLATAEGEGRVSREARVRHPRVRGHDRQAPRSRRGPDRARDRAGRELRGRSR